MQPPIQYIRGYVEFFGMNFAIDKRVLIPRFETEFIVKSVIEWCRKNTTKNVWHIADIGTGSGIIAITIASNLPKARLFATDISKEALTLALNNATRYNLLDRITFLSGDLLSPISKRIDVIAANLPYIPTGRINSLNRSVRDFEPHKALDGGSDGLDLYRRLLDQMVHLNRKPQFCIFEIDEDQGGTVIKEIIQRFPNARYNIHKDASDLVRYITFNP